MRFFAASQDALLTPEPFTAKYERRFATTMPLHSYCYVQYVLNDLQSPFRAPMRTDSNFAFAPPLVLQHIELLEFNRFAEVTGHIGPTNGDARWQTLGCTTTKTSKALLWIHAGLAMFKKLAGILTAHILVALQ